MCELPQVTKNKEQHLEWCSLIQKFAIDNNIFCVAFTQRQYEEYRGDATAILPQIVEPVVVPFINNDLRIKMWMEQIKQRNVLTNAVIKSLRAEDISSIKHPITQMRDITVIQIMEAMAGKLAKYTATELEELQTSLQEGIPFDVDSDIMEHFAKVERIYHILAQNRLIVPEINKINFVQKELVKLRSQTVDSMLLVWNNAHREPGQRVYTEFVAEFTPQFRSISVGTLRQANFTAQAVESTNKRLQALETMFALMCANQANQATVPKSIVGKVKNCSLHGEGNHDSKECWTLLKINRKKSSKAKVI
jgi:hypothetical protein